MRIIKRILEYVANMLVGSNGDKLNIKLFQEVTEMIIIEPNIFGDRVNYDIFVYSEAKLFFFKQTKLYFWH